MSVFYYFLPLAFFINMIFWKSFHSGIGTIPLSFPHCVPGPQFIQPVSNLFNHFPIDGHSGCFQPFALKSNASVDGCVHVSQLHFVSVPLGKIPRSGIAGHIYAYIYLHI